jgi:hypothetical protein
MKNCILLRLDINTIQCQVCKKKIKYVGDFTAFKRNCQPKISQIDQPKYDWELEPITGCSACESKNKS